MGGEGLLADSFEISCEMYVENRDERIEERRERNWEKSGRRKFLEKVGGMAGAVGERSGARNPFSRFLYFVALLFVNILFLLVYLFLWGLSANSLFYFLCKASGCFISFFKPFRHLQ